MNAIAILAVLPALFAVVFLVLASRKLWRMYRSRPDERLRLLAMNYGLEPKPGETANELRERVQRAVASQVRYPRAM